MRTKIHTFFKPIFEFGSKRTNEELIILDFWKRSWCFYGWEPIVHSYEELVFLKDYESLKNRIKDFPTRNDREYEEVCYLRWLLMQEDGGWFSDYDIMNYGFWPIHYNCNLIATADTVGGNVIWGSPAFYKNLIKRFLTNDFSSDVIIIQEGGQLKQHISDMLIMNKLVPDKKINTLDTLTHFSNILAQEKSKIDCILQDPRTKVWL